MTVPTEKLLGKGIYPSDLNDDIVGRTLDAIYQYGSTELFNEITLQVMKQFSLGIQLIHVDTTNFSVYGKNECDCTDGTDFIKIAFEHMIQKTQRALKLDDQCYWIADSALYTEKNIKLLGTETKWITYVPASMGEVERRLNFDLYMI